MHKPTTQVRRRHAAVFAALGDETRLSLVTHLCDGERHSITDLQSGFKMTRQAVTKHLRVLEDVGLVSSVKEGRENLFILNPKPLETSRVYLDLVSEQWDRTLSRLQAFAEE